MGIGIGVKLKYGSSLRAFIIYLLFFSLIIPVFGSRIDVHSAVSEGTNEFLIVDCLLPGQLRKLGRKMTYLTSRRPIRTTARDCEIRGGEYVAYDRSSYASALKVWLPKAQEGDAEAQTYVGEIYEKGLGLQPDYEAAAEWYKRAAEQGNSTAQINLGNLYEKGLGVPKDPRTALYWYRRASGLGEDIAFVPTKELEQLRVEVQTSKQEVESLRQQLLQTQEDLDRTRNELERRRRGVESQQQKLDETRRELERLKKGAIAGGDNVGINALGDQLKKRENELELQRQQIFKLEKEAEGYKTQLAGLGDQKSGVKELEREIERKKGESETLRKELELTQKELNNRKVEAQSQRLKLEQLREELERKLEAATIAGTDDAKIKTLQEQLKTREAELGKQQSEMGTLRDRVVELESTAKSQSKELAKVGGQDEIGKDSVPVIELIDPKVDLTRSLKQVVKTRSGTDRTIVGKVKASVGLHTFTVNGLEETVDDSGLFRFKRRVQTKEVPIKLVAVDKKGRSTSLEFLLAPEGDDKTQPDEVPALRFGKFYALIIGNNDYNDPSWQDLRSPRFDVTIVEKILREQYGFKTEVLINASRRNILEALDKYQQRLDKNDSFLIYYAGHGQLDEELNRGYWIPVDGGDNNSRTNWISTLIIADFLSVMKANHVLVVADSCYSGSLTRSSIPKIDANMSPEALKSLISKKSRMALTSGDLQPVLDAGGGNNSVFARAFIDALKNNKKVMPGQNLHNQVYNSVVLKVEQVPQYAPIRFAGHQAGDYFFVPVN